MNAAETDQWISAAITRWQTGKAPVREQLSIPRPWRDPADTEQLRVTFEVSGPLDQPILNASTDSGHFCLDDPVRLEPVIIAKPWGREIWFSGMEARGESRVRSSHGSSMALGSYLGLAPARLTRGLPPVLLKLLDPRPEPVLGELYLEVHEEKREVYVVTRIDPQAWPDGKGRIRFGINQNKRAEFESDAAFRAAFLKVLAEYERLRRQVDDPDVGPAEARAALTRAEQKAREATLAFTGTRELSVGDVISVPTWIPHSLQQGVQVVEFQTPSYERFILSSTQKVLTQTHWDSEQATARMSLDPPPEYSPQPISDTVDRIVAFDDFGVWRGRLNPGTDISLPEGTAYAIAFCIHGALKLEGRAGSLSLGSNEAALIPASAIGQVITANTETLALLAGPGL